MLLPSSTTVKTTERCSSGSSMPGGGHVGDAGAQEEVGGEQHEEDHRLGRDRAPPCPTTRVGVRPLRRAGQASTDRGGRSSAAPPRSATSTAARPTHRAARRRAPTSTAWTSRPTKNTAMPTAARNGRYVGDGMSSVVLWPGVEARRDGRLLVAAHRARRALASTARRRRARRRRQRLLVPQRMAARDDRDGREVVLGRRRRRRPLERVARPTGRRRRARRATAPHEVDEGEQRAEPRRRTTPMLTIRLRASQPRPESYV